jgi:putative membrane protein
MLWLKALHVFFMVSWFAGLFYLPRLFVYHAMSEDAASRETFKIMERRLYRFVTPFMWLMIGFGLWLIGLYGLEWFRAQTWLHLKLLLVGGLVAYHFYCGKLLREFREDRNIRSHVFYRWFNEIPVLFLLAIIILAVVRPV